MSYPIIVLGAGASFDYIHKEHKVFESSDGTPRPKYRPPLTKDLFASRFEHLINKFPEIKGLVATVNSELRNGGNFENILLAQKEKSITNYNRKKQLIACEFYLQELFKKISQNYGGQSSNNYLALIGAIQDQKNNGQALVINFNYDTLFEDHLGINTINGYLNKGSIKIVKVHGAWNWRYQLEFPSDLSEYVKKTHSYDEEDAPPASYLFLMDMPFYLDQECRKELFISQDYGKEIIDKVFGKKFYYGFYPAIAIPLPSKHEFVCPQRHIEELCRAISQTDKVLIIGWKAEDKHLLDLLRENLKNKIDLFVVSGSKDGIDEVFRRIEEVGVKINRAGECEGFSKFVGSTSCKTFFGI